MQRLQRKVGGFIPRRTADNAEIATLIAEFKEADKALEIVRVLNQTATFWLLADPWDS